MIALTLLAMAIGGPHGPTVPESCWKGFTTNGSNPGLNTMMFCITPGNAVELRVYFPNTAIQEPPTTCLSRGRRMSAEGGAIRVVTVEGQCENGSSMGPYDLTCTSDAKETLSCTYLLGSGKPINVKLEKIFP